MNEIEVNKVEILDFDVQLYCLYCACGRKVDLRKTKMQLYNIEKMQ